MNSREIVCMPWQIVVVSESYRLQTHPWHERIIYFWGTRDITRKKKKNLFLQFIYLEILLVTRLNPHLEFKRWNLYPTKSKDLDFDYNYNCMAKSKKPKRLTFKSTFHRTQIFFFYLLTFSRVY